MLAESKTPSVAAAGGAVALGGTIHRPAFSSICFLRLATNSLIQHGGGMLTQRAVVAKLRAEPPLLR